MTQNVQSTEQYADIYMNLGEIENQNNQHNQDQPKKKVRNLGHTVGENYDEYSTI